MDYQGGGNQFFQILAYSANSNYSAIAISAQTALDVFSEIATSTAATISQFSSDSNLQTFNDLFMTSSSVCTTASDTSCTELNSQSYFLGLSLLPQDFYSASATTPTIDTIAFLENIFANDWTTWVAYGNVAGSCIGGYCSLQDWRLIPGSPVSNISTNGLASDPSNSFVSGAACPAAAGETAIDANNQVYFVNAIRVTGGVCRPGTSINPVYCVFAANVGAYQGESGFTDPCILNGSNNVVMVGVQQNGATSSGIPDLPYVN